MTDFIGPPRPTATTEKPSAYLSRVAHAIREGASVAGVLRMGGAALMVFSLSLFLLQGMEATSDLQRYLLLLGQTALLTCSGFAVGFALKEPRGARVFFSLALISIPANFAVLGAMVYSIAPMDNLITQYPKYASWQSADMKELVVAAVAGLIVLVPTSVFCFAVLARHSKWWLSAAYLLASATLLIPLRETFSITLISSVCAIAVVALLANMKLKRQGVATGEENFAKALLFIPAMLMLARSATLYHIDFHFALAIVVAVYYLMRRLVVTRSEKSVLNTSIQIVCATCAMVVCVMLTSLVTDHVSFIAPTMMFTVLWLALNLELARFIENEKICGLIHGLWAGITFSAVAIDTLLYTNNSALLFNLMLSALLVAASLVTRKMFSAVLGTVAMIGIVIVHSANLFSVILDTGWIGMAVAGGSTIIAGSLLERFWPVIKIRLSNRFSVGKHEALKEHKPNQPQHIMLQTSVDELVERVAA